MMPPHGPIPYARQSISHEDIEAVIQVLRGDWLTQGPTIAEFERAIASYCGARYAVAVSSATAALHLSCLALGLGEGDRLWTSPNTFVASANCALYCGANPSFVDIDPVTWNVSVDELKKKLIEADKLGQLPKVVVPVHFGGQSSEMREIRELAAHYGFLIIEDASHAIGGSYRGNKVGSGAYSDLTVLSFHAVKVMTTGEGGMILTQREDLYQKLIRLRTHGITRLPEEMSDSTKGPYYYEQLELGYNYRITDIQAALGLSQLKRLDQFVERRQVLASRYERGLQGLPVTLPEVSPDVYSAFHLYVIRLKLSELKVTRKQVLERLRELGVYANVHYIPVHLQPYYRALGFCAGQYPEAEKFYEEAVTLPLYPGLREEEQDYVISALAQALGIEAQPSRRFDVVLFDLDGTLADSIPLMRQLYDQFLGEYGACGTAEEFNELNGKTLFEIVDLLKARHGLPASRTELREKYLIAIHARYGSGARVMPGAKDLLVRLRRSGIRMGLVTSSRSEIAGRFLQKNDLRSYFDEVVCAEDFTEGKPSPEPYLTAFNRFDGVEPSRVLVVEDCDNGVRSARSAGLSALRFSAERDPGPSAIKKLDEVWDFVFDSSEESRAGF